jgi:transposase
MQCIPRVSPQVACLGRPGHGTDEQLALGDVGLDGADAGGRVAAIIVCLYLGRFLSEERTAQALAGLFAPRCHPARSPRWLPARPGGWTGVPGTRPRADRRRRRGRVRRDRLPGGGPAALVRCARTGQYTLLMVRPGRGKEAIEAMSVLPAFTGVAVHDAWAPCDGADHQLCCARALQELRAVADAAPGGQWFRAAGALTAMQTPVREAISRPPTIYHQEWAVNADRPPRNHPEA